MNVSTQFDLLIGSPVFRLEILNIDVDDKLSDHALFRQSRKGHMFSMANTLVLDGREREPLTCFSRSGLEIWFADALGTGNESEKILRLLGVGRMMLQATFGIVLGACATTLRVPRQMHLFASVPQYSDRRTHLVFRNYFRLSREFFIIMLPVLLCLFSDFFVLHPCWLLFASFRVCRCLGSCWVWYLDSYGS